MTPTLPRFRSGWGTLTYPRHACMTGEEQARRQSDFSGEILTNGDYSPEFRIEAVDNTM
jgi:hypothetical protein